MKYKSVVEELMQYRFYESAVSSLPGQIETARIEYDAALRAVNMDAVHGGNDTPDEKLISKIQRKKELEDDFTIVKRKLAEMDDALKQLDSDEYRVIFLRYMSGQRKWLERAMEELGYEKTAIYGLHDRALRNYAKFKYGIVTL